MAAHDDQSARPRRALVAFTSRRAGESEEALGVATLQLEDDNDIEAELSRGADFIEDCLPEDTAQTGFSRLEIILRAARAYVTITE